jgi:hypothetical protein
MAKKHGAKQQKRIAKQKAKRLEKRSLLFRRSSKDPTIRLQAAEKWPVVQSLVGASLWDQGIGHLVLARQEPEGGLSYAVFLVDVYCLGVKNAFWRAGSPGDFRDLIRQMEQGQRMGPISPSCLAKIVKGAVEYAQAFGFVPHPDYRHASMLLEGIDLSTCPTQFTFGRDGKPFYVQGPHESFAQATAISQHLQAMGGHYLVQLPEAVVHEHPEIEGLFGEPDSLDEDNSPEESP